MLTEIFKIKPGTNKTRKNKGLAALHEPHITRIKPPKLLYIYTVNKRLPFFSIITARFTIEAPVLHAFTCSDFYTFLTCFNNFKDEYYVGI